MNNSLRNTKHIRVLAVIMLAAALFSMSTVFACADVGPKPSVNISIENCPDYECYGTLLGKAEGYGPYHAVDPDVETGRYDNDARAAYNAFSSYAQSTEGFFFWGEVFTIDSSSFSWGYYPPEDFIILIYDPETAALYASGEESRFAFDSYYRVDLQDDGTLAVQETPYLTRNLMSFAIRVAVTITVELLIALVFRYRDKKEIRLIVITNCITQVMLNLLLSFIDYTSGLLTWVFIFPVLEIAVFIIEAIVYAIGLRSHSRKRAVCYALLANAATALIGFMIGVAIR